MYAGTSLTTGPIGSSGLQFARTPGVGPPQQQENKSQSTHTNASTHHAHNTMQPSSTGQPAVTVHKDSRPKSEPHAHTITSTNIYSAVYSSVPVYEIMCRGIAVMRRRADSYLNATQILKVAGVDKGKRTKILEKEILTGTHEKVQGGYGKYQGTWIPFERGRDLARQFAVEQFLQPLFDYKPDPSGKEPGTPTKEQALAAQRKQLYQPGVGVTPISTNMAPNAHGETMTRPSPPKRSNSAVPSHGSQRTSPTPSPLHPSMIASSPAPSDLEPPRKRPRSSPGALTSGAETIDVDANSQHHRAVLLAIFLNDNVDDLAVAPDAYGDLVIDDQGHTALHWAAALARIHILRTLIEKGANFMKQNFAGETALMRSVLVSNAYDNQIFYPILEHLHPTIAVRDNANRTILHHIALTAGIKGRAAAARYYMENVLEWMAKHGPPFKTLADVQDKNGDTALNIAARVGSKSLFQQLVDVGANRALANKVGLRPDDFGLNTNEGPSEDSVAAGRRVPIVPGADAKNREQQLKGRREEIASATVSRSKDIIADITKMVSQLDEDFGKELTKKQTEVDAVHEDMRVATKELAEMRRQMQSLKDKSTSVVTMEEKLKNLSRGLAFENERGQGSVDNLPSDLHAHYANMPGASDAYAVTIRKLSSHVASLRQLSADREKACAKIIAMCVGLRDGGDSEQMREQVDRLVGPLLAAVESDGGEVDLARVKMFMNKVRQRDGILGPQANRAALAVASGAKDEQ